MKKTIKISLTVVTLFVVGLLFIYLFRNTIVSFALRKVIAVESAKKITLSLDDVEFDPLEGSVSLFQPSLKFSDVFLKNNKALKVDTLSFEKLGIYNVSVRDLLFDRQLVAEKVLVFKPAVHLEMIETTTVDTNRFSPGKLLDLLNTNSTTFTSLKIRIDEVDIRYGSINMQMDSTADFVPDLLDYTLLLKGFATQSEGDVPSMDRILYSDEVIFQLKNVSKRLKSGYNLQIDSVIYSSKWQHLITNGVLLNPIWKPGEQINKPDIAIQLIKIDGLSVSELRGIEKLHLSNFEISDAEISNFVKGTSNKTSQSTSLPAILNDVSLDSLNLHHISFFTIEGETDTTIAAENIAVIIENISFDSTLLENPLKYLRMGDVSLTTDFLKLLDQETGVDIRYNNLSYSSDNSQLNVKGIHILTDTLKFKGPQLDLNLAKLQIDGFSIHDFLQEKKQYARLKLTDPYLHINLRRLKPETSSLTKKNNKYLDLIVLQDLQIESGFANLVHADKFNLSLNGINLETENLNLALEDSLHLVNFNVLKLNLAGLDAVFSKGAVRLNTGAIFFDDKIMEVNKVEALYNQKNRVENTIDFAIGIGKFQLESIDLNTLLFQKKLSTSSVTIESPVVKGYFKLPDAGKKNSVQAPVNLPVDLHLGNFTMEKGELDLVLEQALDSLHFQSKFDLQLGEIHSGKTPYFKWLNPSDWEMVLSKLKVSSADYDLNSDLISLNARQSSFHLDALTLIGKQKAETKQKQFGIEKVMLPKLALSGLHYQLLLEEDSLMFSKLSIENPGIYLSLYDQKSDNQMESKQPAFNAEKLLDIVYDTIDLNGLELNFTNISDTSHSIIKVGNFDLYHFSDRQNNHNLMREIAFQLEEFSIFDSLKNTSLHLHKLVFNPEKLTLSIDNIDWFKKNKGIPSLHQAQEKDIEVHTSEIVFSGTFLKKELPSSLQFNKLSFSDLDISVTDNKSGENPKKTELEYDIKMLEKYARLISRFAVDTTVFSDISFHLKTIDGAEQHAVKFDSIGLLVNRIGIDTSMLSQKNPVFIHNLVVDLKGRTRITKDSLYEIQSGRIHYNFPQHRITVDSFYVLPRYDEAESFRRAKYQKGIINLFAPKVEFNNLRIEELLNDKQLHFGGIEVTGVRFSIVKDKKYPIEPGSYKAMPQDMIRSIAQKIRVDSLRVFDSYLYFKLYPEKKSNQPGEIFLDKLNAKAYNFSNFHTQEKVQEKLKISLNANIMGESRMDATFYFPLQDTANNWWFSFKTEKIDFTKLNSMTQHLVGLSILRGKGSVDAPLIKGDDFNTTGKMTFRYKKIRLSLYNRKKAEIENGIFSSMANFFINDLVIKSNNPKFARRPRIGLVFAERDTQKAIVNFAFKSILSGMLSTLGINQKEQRKERKEYKKEEKQTGGKVF